MTEQRRFNRDYELIIAPRDREIVIRPPIRISFTADKSIRGQLNKLRLQIYNLEERKRLALVKDAEDQGQRIPLRLSVGYQGRLEMVFKGTVHIGLNERQGADIVTFIECMDGWIDYKTAFTSRTVKGGQVAVDAALSDMPGTDKGKITQRPTLTRPKVLVGNSAKLIEDMTGPGENWFIDDEQLYILKDNEVISRFVPEVSAATGLISTPTRENKEVTFQTLMNPSVRIGRRVSLRSQTAPHLDGVYRMETISYSGDNFGEDWAQTCTGRLVPGPVVI